MFNSSPAPAALAKCLNKAFSSASLALATAAWLASQRLEPAVVIGHVGAVRRGAPQAAPCVLTVWSSGLLGERNRRFCVYVSAHLLAGPGEREQRSDRLQFKIWV